VCFTFPCGPGDIIRDGENGLLVPEGDIPALSSAMARLMRDPSLRERMSAKAREIVDVYSEEKVMQQWIQCFQRLLQ
jgi:glycosyltransferase involved in cell wall biosynthesis